MPTRSEMIPFLFIDVIDPNELEYLAYNGQQDLVYSTYMRIPQEERKRYTNKYVLHAVVLHSVQRINEKRGTLEETDADMTLVAEVLKQFAASCEAEGIFPRELFEVFLLWSETLVSLSRPKEALQGCDKALALGLRRYPDLYIREEVLRAGVFGALGKAKEAQSILSSLAERPYLVVERGHMPHILLAASQVALLNGHVAPFKPWLFQGLRSFYTNMEARRAIVERLVHMYRGFSRMFFDDHISRTDKFLFLIHWIDWKVQNAYIFQRLPMDGIMRFFLLGYVYYLNYISTRSEQGLEGSLVQEKKHILVTRAMGGIGDLLMMTPGLHALKETYPNEDIDLAIPRRFFPLFQGNPDVTLVDIENEALRTGQYRRWVNLSDCPAARVESRTAPEVRKNRIEIFAHTMGIRGRRLAKMDYRPRYYLSEEDKQFQKQFWRDHELEEQVVIGIQPYAAERYRDYPSMKELVAAVAQSKQVLLFHDTPLQGFDHANVLKVQRYSLRQSLALASGCSAFIAPDSFFVHFAAVFDIPCVALFGPIDGKLRVQHYRHSTYLDARSKLGCIPCWRNEMIPCKLLNTRQSPCMGMIAVEEICKTLEGLLKAKAAERH